MILKEARSEDTQRHFVDRLVEYWDQGKAARRAQEAENVDSVRAYHYQHPVKKTFRKGRSRGVTPLALVAARTLVSDRVTGMIPFPKFFRVSPTELVNEAEAEMVATELLYMIEEMNFPRLLRPLVLQAALCGSSPYFLEWRHKYRTISGPKLQGGLGLKDMMAAAAKGQFKEALAAAKDAFSGFEIVHERKLVYSGVCLEPLNWFDVVQDPQPPAGMDETEWWRQVQSRRSKAQLDQMAEERLYGYRVYENIDKIKWNKDEPEDTDEVSQQLNQAVGLDLGATNVQHAPLIRTHYGPFDIMIDGQYKYYENIVATYTADKKLLRFEYNTDPEGDIPVQFLTWGDAGVPGTSKSESAIGPTLSTGSLVTNFNNDYRDMLGKVVKGQKMVRRDSPLLDGTVEGVSIEMDGILPVNSMDDIGPVPHDVTLPPLIALMDRYELLFNKIAGATSRTTMGEASTATEIAQVGATMAKETKESVQHMQEQIERDILRRCVVLRYHYGQAGPTRRFVKGESGQAGEAGRDRWVSVPRELFNETFDIKCVGSGVVAERAQQLAGIHQFLQSLPTLPPHVLSRVNFDLILSRLWALAVGRDDDEVIKPIAELEEAIAEIERSRGEGGQAGQGSGGNVIDLRMGSAGNQTGADASRGAALSRGMGQ